jgi:hypothetical protein
VAEEAEARIKLVADSMATEQVVRLAGALEKASKAEEDLQRRMKERGRIVRDLVRLDATRPGGVIDRLGGGGGSGGGGGFGGFGGGGGAGGRRGGGVLDTLTERLAGRLGMSAKSLTVAGGVAAAAGVVRQGMLSWQERKEIEADPFLSARQRNERIARSLPFGVGRVFAGAQDWFRASSGRDALMGQIGRQQTEEEARNAVRIRAAGEEFAAKPTEDRAAVTAKAMSGLSLRRESGFDRGTVLGEKLHQEEQKLLPLVHQRQVAAAKMLAAEGVQVRASQEVGHLQEQIKKHDEKIEKFRRDRAAADAPGGKFSKNDLSREASQSYVNQELREHQLRKAAEERLVEAQKRLAEAKQGAAGARTDVRNLDVEITRSKADVLTGREDTARGQARRFGMMGVEGRLTGRLALQLLQQVGIDNAPADLINAAAAYAPETVGKMAEGAGAKELPTADRLTGHSGEFRDTNVGAIGKEAQAARDAAAKAYEDAAKNAAADTAQAVENMGKAISKAITDGMEKVVQEIEARAFAKNNVGNHGNP